jgi:hypothetical protein
MHELEKLHMITYNSWQGFYEVHTPSRSMKFYKDKQGLPYINLDESEEAAVMLLHMMTAGQDKVTNMPSASNGIVYVPIVWGNYEGYTKCKVLRAKEVH